MPVDPYTGEVLPYGPYDGPWPPPEWGEDPTALPPVIPDAPEIPATPQPLPQPEAQEAAAAADALFAEPSVQLGQPKPVAEPVVEPVDESLITMGDEEPEAPPLTDDERAARLDQISAGADLGTTAPDVESPELLDPFGETYEQRVAGKTSDEIALDQHKSDQAAQAKYEEQAREAVRIKNEAAMDEERVFRASMARAAQMQEENDAEAARLANEEVDPDGWRSSRTTFQTIAMIVAGVVGGLMQSKNGGRNLGIEMIDNEIARHIQAQRENLAHRRQMLGDRRMSVEDMRAQAEAQRRTEQAFTLGAFDRAIAKAEADKLQYDPMGNRARQTEMMQRQLAARREQLAQEILDENRKRADADIRLAMEIEKHNSQMAKDAAQTAKLKGAGSGGGSAAKLKRTVTEWNSMFPGAKVPDDGTPRTLAEYRSLSEVAKSVTEPTEGEKVARTEEKEAEQKLLRNPLAKPGAKGERHFINVDGTPAMAGDAPRATVINDQVAAMTTLAQLVAQQREQIAKASAADLANPRSDTAKLLKSNAATIANLLRTGYKMGTLDEAAMNLANTVQGGDPTAFLGDASVGLEQMLVQAEIKLDNDLKGPGGWRPAEGENFRLPRYKAPKAKADRYVDEAASKGVALEGGFAGMVKGPRMAEGQAISVRKITEKAAKGDTQAVSDLAGLAQSAPNPAVKDAAAAALSDLAKAGNTQAAAALKAALEAVSLTKEGE